MLNKFSMVMTRFSITDLSILGAASNSMLPPCGTSAIQPLPADSVGNSDLRGDSKDFGLPVGVDSPAIRNSVRTSVRALHIASDLTIPTDFLSCRNRGGAVVSHGFMA